MLPSLYYDARWIELKESDESLEISEKLGLPSYLAKHLAQELDLEDLNDFLYPSEYLSIIAGTEEVAAALDRAVGQGKRILVFGDYDVDGLSSVALMVSFLRLNGLEPLYYVPSRYEDGYGLTMEAISRLPETDLLITFDCGITAVKEVEYLQEKGVEVLITDHHQPGLSLPQCPLINPQLGGDFKDLAGVGVAYKLALYMSEVYGYEFSQDLVALAMLGTISDLMPLVGENRYLVKEGLRIFNLSQHRGFVALRDQVKGQVQAQDIAFKIGPMINAVGRLGQAQEALDVLLGQGQVEKLVVSLLASNQERKEEESLVVAQALKLVDKDKPAIIVSGDWKKGLLGLVASRLTKIYRKPAIVLDKELNGSSRSLGNFSIIEALDSASQHLARYGGHIMAAGLTVREESFESFKEDFYSYTEENLDFLETRPSFKYISLEVGDLNLGLLDELDLLAPYGVSNPQLTFRLNQLDYMDTRALGTSGRAFISTFKARDRLFEFLYFDKAVTARLKKGQYDLLFNVEKDLFRDILSIKLLLKDLRPSQPSLENSTLFMPFYQGLAASISSYQGNKIDFSLPTFKEDRIYRWEDREFPLSFPHPSSLEGEARKLLLDLPTREELVRIFSWLRKQGGTFNWDQPKRPFLAMISLKIFEELGLISYTNRKGSCYYQISSKQNDLEKSLTYRKVQEIREDTDELA